MHEIRGAQGDCVEYDRPSPVVRMKECVILEFWVYADMSGPFSRGTDGIALRAAAECNEGRAQSCVRPPGGGLGCTDAHASDGTSPLKNQGPFLLKTDSERKCAKASRLRCLDSVSKRGISPPVAFLQPVSSRRISLADAAETPNVRLSGHTQG